MKYLQYIQGDSVNNWIDPDITVTDDTEIELRMAFTPSSKSYQYGGYTQWNVKVGNRTRTLSIGCNFAVIDTIPTTTIATGSPEWIAPDVWTIDTPHTLFIRIGDTTDQSDPTPKTCVYVDGTKATSRDICYDDTHLYKYVLCQSVLGERPTNVGVGSPCRLYGCKIWQGGALVRDFVPVLDNGVVTLYDKVTDTVFIPGGTVPFTAGPQVPDLDFSQVKSIMVPVPAYTQGLPYDAEVEYLESNGTQYIETGLYLQSSDTVSMRASISTASQSCFWSARQVPFPRKTFTLFYLGLYGQTTGRFDYGIQQTTTTQDVDFVSINFNDWFGTHEYKAVANKLYIDDTLYATCQAAQFTTGGPVRLLASEATNAPGTFTNFFHGKVYGFKVVRNGEVLADYIPVRKNGVGYFYDKITGGMFGNSGTGTLTYGNDKTLTLYPVEKAALPKFPPVENAVEVEYLQTDGGKCFDTGIAIDTDIGIDMTFWTPEHTSGHYILGNIPDWSTNRFQFGWFDYTTRQTLRFDSYTTENREFALGYNKWRRLTYGDGIVQVDNEVKAYTPASIITTGNLYVMGRGTTNDGYAGLRIKGCRVFKSGVLVKDLIPLKVGTEGCLYDKVTGTVLHAVGRYGTETSITCGPEKTTPIWERPIGYVKSGLIGWWDGIFNTRDGHSDTTTIWEDLGPNQFDAVARTTSSWRWLDKCYNGLSNTGEGFAIPRDFTNALATALTNGALTIEMVFACDENRRMSIFSQYGTGTGFEFYPQSYAGVYRSYFSGSPDVWANVWPTGGYDTIHTGSTVVGGTVANVVAYGDGGQKTTNATLPAASTIDLTKSFVLGGENSRATMSINGRLYCVRVYNRALTPVEVAQNAAVDRGRFGI